MSFLTNQATPGFSPSDNELSPQLFNDILDLTDPYIAYSDLTGDRKEMDNSEEDFFSLSM